jgi:hypothetical protein
VLEENGFAVAEKLPGPPMPIIVWDASVSSRGRRLFHALSWLVSAALIPLMRGGDRDGWSLFFIANATESSLQ